MASNAPQASFLRPAAMMAATLLSGACATTAGGGALPVGQQATVQGRIVGVDTTPWTYDGNAVVKVSTPRGIVDVHLPARWNLCKAPPPDDMQSLKAGDAVTVAGTVTAASTLVVCERPEHRLRKAR